MLEEGRVQAGDGLDQMSPKLGNNPHQDVFVLYSPLSERKGSNEVLNYIKPFNFCVFST